jgi:predicted nucleic acid-binding Zn finger protein
LIVSEEERIESAVMSGSVKMLEFLPSHRKLWVVVGKDNEYWADPELGFCSCKDFYFNTLSGGDPCYHLKSVRRALEEGRAEVTRYSDGEYAQMLQAIADDSENTLLR